MSTEQSSTDSEQVGARRGSDALEVLPVRDIDPDRAAALKAAARHAFVAAHRRHGQSRWIAAAAVYHRALEPALVATLCSAYLSWALLKVLTLHL